MTNKEYFDSLSSVERRKCMTQYFDHPLFKYIDWKSFFASEDGNEMDFVMGEKVYYEDFGDVYILNAETRECEDYVFAYVVSSGAFMILPAPEPVT